MRYFAGYISGFKVFGMESELNYIFVNEKPIAIRITGTIISKIIETIDR